RDIYERPANTFVADFIGNTNFVEGTVKGSKDNQLVVDTRMGELNVNAQPGISVGSKVSLSIRPDDVHLFDTMPAPSAHTLFVGTVTAKVFLGECLDFKIDVKEAQLLARAHPSVRTPVGEKIHITINPEKCTLLAA